MNQSANRFISLMYHNVCELPARGGTWPGFERLSPSITDYFVDRSVFTRHCEIIAQRQRGLRPDELGATPRVGAVATSNGSGRDDQPRVLLTFDDGWRGTLDVAGPILAAHGLQGLLFVTTDLIGHPQFVDCTQLRDLGATFQIGSHAKSHRLLAALPDREVDRELRESKQTLEHLLGCAVDAIAYPGGSFDERVLRLTRDAGYRLVFTSQPVVNALPSAAPWIGRLAVKRGTSLDTISRWLRGDLRQERLRALGLRATKRLLGRAVYRRLRGRLISENASQLEMTDLAAAGAAHDGPPPVG